MNGRTPTAAVHSLRDALQLALSCVTNGVLITSQGGHAPAAAAHMLSLQGSPVRLAGEARVALTVAHWYRLEEYIGVREPWRVQTTGYDYRLDGADGREIASYHWHPEGASHVVSPHLHLGAGAGALRRELTRAHFPTGWVMLPEVLRLAVETFSVRPLRRDWSAILDRAQAALGEPHG